MDNNLERRVRSHTYVPNPAVAQYLEQQQQQSRAPDEEQITVRERRPSGISVASEGQASGDDDSTHFRCITPLRELRYELNCVICLSPAINPFRCTQPMDSQNGCGTAQHLCCFNCIGKYMLILNRDRFDCPYCKQNEFNLENLIFPEEHIIREAEKLVVHCPNNCGVMGSPLAIANHICRLQDPHQVGHTGASNILDILWSENLYLIQERERMRIEMREVLHNYNQRRRFSLDLQSNNNQLMEECNQLRLELEESETCNQDLRNSNQQMEQMLSQLDEKLKETVIKYKRNLKFLAKHYKTRVQELQDVNQRLTHEFNALLYSRGDGPSAAEHIRTRSDWSQTDSYSDVPSLGSLFGQSSSTNSSQERGASTGSDISDEEVTPMSQF